MQTIKLDISAKNNVQPIYVKQRDVGHRFSVELYENGVPYVIGGDNSFSVWYSGASGNGYYTKIGDRSAFEVSGNTVVVEMILQMVNNHGDHQMCLVMNGADGAQLGLWNIPYYAEEIPGIDSEEAEQYFDEFATILETVEEDATRAEEFANLASDAADRAENAADRVEEIVGDGGGVKPKDVIITATFDTEIDTGAGIVWEGGASASAFTIANAIGNGATVILVDNDNIVYSYDGDLREPSAQRAFFRAEIPESNGIAIYHVYIDNTGYASRNTVKYEYGGGGDDLTEIEMQISEINDSLSAIKAPGKNIFDKNAAVTGKLLVVAKAGVLSSTKDSAAGFVSGWMSVEAGKNYVFHSGQENALHIDYCDDQGILLLDTAVINTDVAFTIPDGVAKIRIAGSIGIVTNLNPQMEKGDSYTGYEPFGEQISVYTKEQADEKFLSDSEVFEVGINKYNKNAVLIDTSIVSGAVGAKAATKTLASAATSDWMAVEPNETYCISCNYSGSIFLDLCDGNDILTADTSVLSFSPGNPVTFTTQENTKKMRIAGSGSVFAMNLQVQRGDSATSYREYKKVLRSEYEPEKFTHYDGLNAVAFGTSLTYRAQTTGGYLQYLPQLCGMMFDNQGVGSSKIYGDASDSILNKILGYESFATKNVVIIEGFVNDWWQEAPLGIYTDTTTDTVCGCLRTAIDHILTQNANATIFVVLDHYGNGDMSSVSIRNNLTPYQYYEECAKVCELMGVIAVKEYALSGISQYTPQYFLDNDTIHCNESGAKQSANTIWAVMKQYFPKVIV